MYPILFIHGLGDRKVAFIESFRMVRNALIKKGYKCYISSQDGLGTIEDNAKFLKEEILEILRQEKVSHIHLIAHSKGGLDARYAISKYGMDKYVLTLTTLSTPHHGAEMSKQLLKMPKFLAKIVSKYWNIVYKILGDKKPNLLKTAYELTPEYMKKFNQEVFNKDNVYYQSYSAYPKHHSFLMFLPSLMNKVWKINQSDGLVTKESAMWGVYKGQLPLWHHHFVHRQLFKKRNQEVINIYEKIIQELKLWEDKNKF